MITPSTIATAIRLLIGVSSTGGFTRTADEEVLDAAGTTVECVAEAGVEREAAGTEEDSRATRSGAAGWETEAAGIRSRAGTLLREILAGGILSGAATHSREILGVGIPFHMETGPRTTGERTRRDSADSRRCVAA